MTKLTNQLMIVGSTIAFMLPVSCSGPTGPSSDSGRQQLVDALDAGRVVPGDLLLLVGFGAGMTSAAAVLRWNPLEN